MTPNDLFIIWGFVEVSVTFDERGNIVTNAPYSDSKLKIFSLDANLPLAEKIAEEVGVELGLIQISQFADGEIKVKVDESIRGAHIYIVQPTSDPVNDHLMSLMITADAFRRASAKTINLVIPYFGYGRQDRQAAPREPLSAKLVANMFELVGADRVLTLDLHTPQMQGFFNVPVDDLQGEPLLANYFIQNGIHGDNVVVVSPDHSGVSESRRFADFLHAPIAIVDKRSQKYNHQEVVSLIGDVAGKTAIVIDDMIDTGETVKTAVQELQRQNAKEIYVAVTHALLSGSAVDNLKYMDIQKLVVTDSIQMPEAKKQSLGEKLAIVSVAEVFAEAIVRIHENRSVSPLFVGNFEYSNK
ncbi:ribose-phosphate pyrophosphokinase [Aerococcaceae bacterium DSM 111022]|nr:ribose-phosphate pyrophosphokinase [Aerococcaceae bacterium DSM 111022]